MLYRDVVLNTFQTTRILGPNIGNLFQKKTCLLAFGRGSIKDGQIISSRNHEPLTSNSFRSLTHHRIREENPTAIFKEKPVLEAPGATFLP
jgi:hypothetical protein